MEILKHGTKMREVICPDCNCDFVFNKNEEKYTWIQSPFDGQFFQSYCWINCPECNKEIQIRS